VKVAIVGGIYGKSADYRKEFSVTPETTLEGGLRERGIDVSTFGHLASVNCSRFDIIHVHHLSWGALSAATDASQCAFAFTPHNGQYMSGSLPPRFRWAMRFVMRRADAIVALSSVEKTFLEANHALSGAISTVIANGIPVGTYKMERANSKGVGVPWQILYVGQLIPIKRVDVLLQAVSQISAPVIVKLVYQNAELESELRLLASKLGIGDAVHFLGPRKPSELGRLYNQSDLFILPSSCEALPSVVTEAMLCGTPIIATDVGGVRAQLAGFGALVPPNNPERLKSAIVEAISDYGSIEGQASQMSKYARNNFSVDSMIDRHIDLYRQLSHQAPRRRSRIVLRPWSLLVKLGLEYPLRTRPSSSAVASPHGRI
jgi:glycosyltransferase involved in cell wall biosynthesis